MKKYIINEEFLGRWNNNELTKEELEFFKSTSEYTLYNKILEKTACFKPLEINVDKSFNTLVTQLERKPKVIPLFTKYRYAIGSIAASLILLLGFFIFQNITSKVTFNTGISEKKSVQLPDGSKVELNANSSLTYNKKTFNKKRVLKLNGEAFFKVSEGNKFEVKTQSGSVQVLGTQFNIVTSDFFFETICYQGKVAVNLPSGQKILQPSEGIRIFNNKEETLKVNAAQPSWISNISTFKKVSLSRVINELQNQFDIKISIQKLNTDTKVTTHFSHNNLNTALQTIFSPLKINYTFKSAKEIVISQE